MRGKKAMAAVLAACMMLSLAGCGGGTAVYVQSVKALGAMGGIAPGDRFPGIVVSENVTEISKDAEKTVKELKVREGDDVEKGQELFSYDTDELKLSLEKQKLELEQLNATIENYEAQIKQLEKERGWASGNSKLEYTIEIQSTQLDLKEAEMNVKTKMTEVQNAETLLEHATVVSPVKGRVQSISENGTDNYGNPLPYITIQQVGSYRIKGTLGELQRGGIVEGRRLKILSRTDPDQFWMGTVTLVDYENPTQQNNNNYYVAAGDEMTTSSKYPFYVELENTDGLILGQHVYLEVAVEEGAVSGIPVSMAFICYEDDGTAYVWAENRSRLEKREVTLGQTNDMMGTVEILEGLTESDYIAFPDMELCREGASTTRSVPAEENDPAPEGEVG